MALYVNGKKVAGIGLPGKSAYQYAVDGGYTGTEEEFQEVLANAGSTGGNPPGTILWYAATTPPDGYLVCDGSLISRTNYAALFAVIGTTFGAGDGSTTFALPNLQAAFIRGAGSQGMYSAVFGKKQEATYIEYSNTSYGTSFNVMQEYEASETVNARNGGRPYQGLNVGERAYRGHIRPFNITLTPIIKY